jgi:class 3 adenylate cyclase/tetratricopeptide (TPR) repeat protein
MRVCPACGEQNPARARFCLNCGTPLGVTSQADAEERRLVTVLFCDLVGFTARSDRADPEEVKETLRPFHARVQREIERHGGWVAEFLGDGVLAIFGAPTAHEDDPERAIRAALRIQEAIGELNAEDPALQLAARVGIETGEAVVSFGPGPQIGGNVTGDVTNTASRLQGVAPAGGIVVGEATHRATAGLFRFRELQPVSVKGKADPLPIWQPLAPTSRMPADTAGRFRTPLVGRRDELDTLQRLLLRTIRDRTPGFAVITGEPGVGKTRLVAELARLADEVPELVRWRQGRPLPYGEGVAFSALADIVKAEAGILESDRSDEARAKLLESFEATVQDATEREVLLDALAPLLGLATPGDRVEEGDGWGSGATEGDRFETFATWRRYLEILASDRPLVLVFEDLHRASGPFLEFVDHILDWSAGLPMLVLAVGRPELAGRRPEWIAWSAATHVEVRPLAPRETRQLVGLLLEEVRLSPDTVERVVDRSEGLPLYAEEFVAMLRERPHDASGDGGGAPAVPASLRTLVAARLDGLPVEERAFLQDVAVVGQSFWTGAAAAVTGLPADPLDRIVGELARRGLIHEVRPSTVEGEGEFAFAHAVVRDVAYAQIPRRIRAAKHRAVAEWIERIAGDRVADRAEALAQHFGQAVVLSRAAGDLRTSEELLEPTVRYVLLAAERALGFDANRAHRLYARALSLLPTGHPMRARALRDAGVAAAALGRFAEGEDLLRAALAEYQERDDQVGRADVMVALARQLLERGETEAVDPLLDVALGLLEAREPGPALARAYARHAGRLLVVGDYEAAERRARQGLELARSLAMGREEVLALNYVGASRSLLGAPDGLDTLRAAIERGRQLGLGSETAIAMNNLAENLRFLEGPAASLHEWETMIDFCSERGLSTSLAWARDGLIQALFDLGRWDEVLAMEPEAEAWDRAQGPSPFGAAARMLAAWIELRRGRIEEAARRTRDLLPRVARIGYTEYEAPAFVLCAEVALEQARPEEARALLDRFEQSSRTDRLFRTTLLPVAARVLVALGDVERIRPFLDGPAPISRRERLSTDSTVAVVAEADGDLAAAADGYRSAAADWRAYGMPLEEGQLLVGLARCERGLGNLAAATAAARQAVEVLSPLAARPLIQEAEALG